MKHTIDIDGEKRDIDVRAMDEDFIVYRKMYVPPITRENLHTGTPDDPAGLTAFLRSDAPRVIEEFFRHQIRTMGSCAVLAWDGDGVIGKMYFTTKELLAEVGKAAQSLGLQHDEFPGCMCIESSDMPKSSRASHTTSLSLCWHRPVGRSERSV